MPDITCTYSEPVLADGSTPSSNDDNWNFKTKECDYDAYIQDYFNATPSSSLDISGSTVTASLDSELITGISEYMQYDFTFRILILLVTGFFFATWFFKRS